MSASTGRGRTMVLDILICVAGFLLLYLGAEWLVKGASNLARSFGIPPIVIGLTVVAFGTSAPEFVVSLISSLEGSSMIAVGNVFGSNICNIALVLGLAAILQPITCHRVVVRRDIPIMVLVTIVVLALCWDDLLSRREGALLFLGLIAYTLMNYAFARRGKIDAVDFPEGAHDERGLHHRGTWMLVGACVLVVAVAIWRTETAGAWLAGGLILGTLFVFIVQEVFGLRMTSRFLMFLIVLIGIYGVVLGADAVVGAAKRIMTTLGVSEQFIGLTIVAFGTSLPELATSIVAAMRKEMDISIGNLVGSNVFNLLGVLGLTAFIRPIPIPGGFIGSGMIIDGAVMLGVSALPLLFLWKGSTVRRWHGVVLVLCYVGFLAYLIQRG